MFTEKTKPEKHMTGPDRAWPEPRTMNMTFVITKPGHPFSRWLSEQDTNLTFSEFLFHFYRLVDDPSYNPINDSQTWCKWPGGWANLSGLSFWEVDCFGDGARVARERARSTRKHS